ncbi:substrate-binding domain-containing protein [Leucobacter allii]|uniref:Substrate-binding domain-containing protein n=1 Tax=Leucobacter allii TaxID=2932247 RepID=A0ABY4FI27_9MICO|nr:LysR substrate-binding domain-containing protein [Leucobacter allii]UOQ56333.1 substrate-binding domain-containing protein [Leucobacter allii]
MTTPPDARPDADAPRPLRLGFPRGVAPSTWARRWKAATPGRVLELVPLDTAYGSARDAADPATAEAAASCDVLIERTSPGARPADTERSEAGPGGAGAGGAGGAGAGGGTGSRHAIRLYAEVLALVVPRDHELAEQDDAGPEDLGLVTLLDHPDHHPSWPAAAPWAEPAWMPAGPEAALALVATGAGAMLLPLPLARHLASKREHVVLPLRAAPGEAQLEGSVVWAVWDRERDDATVQHLAGILRGRTAGSSRESAREEARSTAREPRTREQPRKAAPKLKPNSRGAQLQAAKEKAERKRAEARQAKRRKRR